MEIDAIINSADDPQLPRCIDSVRDQTVPFSKIIHNNNVCPVSEAFNIGIIQTTGEWVMEVLGDMILDLDAVEKIVKCIENNNDPMVSSYHFGLTDTFLNCKIGYLGVLRGSLYRNIRFENSMVQDAIVVRSFRKKGWKIVKLVDFIVGTHFDNPDDFQIFSRFYVHGIRYPGGYHRRKIVSMLEKVGSKIALDAIKFADEKKFYPGARNIEFNRQIYEEYKRLHS